MNHGKGGFESFGRCTLVMLLGTLGNSCEGEHRPYMLNAGPFASSPSTEWDAGAQQTAGTDNTAAASSGESSISISRLGDAPQTGSQASSPCANGSAETCGPTRAEGVCRFGTRTCSNGVWGECLGAVLPGNRDCGSIDDNDCDGQADDTIDNVCRCPIGGSRSCGEHPGLDGKGQCQAGQQTCALASDHLSSDWGTCEGAIGPGTSDSCSVVGDDSNCDGVPNGGCTCVEGATQPCGPNTDKGICQPGISTCRNGTFGSCEGATFAGTRDCASAQDNDCDGLPDNTRDSACPCAIGEVQACGAHPGRDGIGECHAGQQVCEGGPVSSTTRFGTCTGSVAPAQRDSCGVRGDDADCNGRAMKAASVFLATEMHPAVPIPTTLAAAHKAPAHHVRSMRIARSLAVVEHSAVQGAVSNARPAVIAQADESAPTASAGSPPAVPALFEAIVRGATAALGSRTWTAMAMAVPRWNREPVTIPQPDQYLLASVS